MASESCVKGSTTQPVTTSIGASSVATAVSASSNQLASLYPTTLAPIKSTEVPLSGGLLLHDVVFEVARGECRHELFE